MADERPSDWNRLHLWQIQPLRDLLMIAAAVGLVWLGYKLSIVTVPLLLALTLAYLFEPVIAWVTRGGRVSRPGASVGIIFLAGLLVIVPLIIGIATGGGQIYTSARRVATSTNLVVRSISNPKDEHLRTMIFAPDERALPENERDRNAWVRLRDWIVEQEPRYKAWDKKNPSMSESLPSDMKPTGKPEAKAESPPPPVEKAPAKVEEPGPSTTSGESHEKAATDDASKSAPTEAGATKAELPDPSNAYIIARRSFYWLNANAQDLVTRTLGAGGGAVNAAASFAESLGKFAFSAFLCSFFFFFFSTGWGKVLHFWEGMIPERRKGRVIDLIRQMDAVISGFIRGRITIAAIMVVTYSLCYSLIGVPAWLVLGPIVGIMTIIPYAAGFIGVPVGILLLALEPGLGWRGTWWWIVLSPLLVTAVNQFLDDYVLTPRIQGKTTGMDMPTVLFASVAGGALAGFYGLLLAIPIAACAKILIQEIFWPPFRAWLAGKATDFIPIEKD